MFVFTIPFHCLSPFHQLRFIYSSVPMSDLRSRCQPRDPFRQPPPVQYRPHPTYTHQSVPLAVSTPPLLFLRSNIRHPIPVSVARSHVCPSVYMPVAPFSCKSLLSHVRPSVLMPVASLSLRPHVRCSVLVSVAPFPSLRSGVRLRFRSVDPWRRRHTERRP